MGEWTAYFEELLALDQERFELEILLFFEDCGYDWQEIDQRIGALPPTLKGQITRRVETMRENTVAKMTKNLHTLFLAMGAGILLMALFVGLAFGWVPAVHFGAISLFVLLLLVMAGLWWIGKN